jgi:dihydrofolate reductase
MSKVVFSNTVSLDGFVAGPNDGPENGLGDGGDRLFTWYFSGDTEIQVAGSPLLKVSKVSADLLSEEIAGAWGGHPPGEPCFVLTHTAPQEWVKEGSPFTFVTDGVESAIRQAKQAAGNKDVLVMSANVAQQCLKAGLLDELLIDVAPVLLHGGLRLYDNLGAGPTELEIVRVVEAPGVTHLRYAVVK